MSCAALRKTTLALVPSGQMLLSPMLITVQNDVLIFHFVPNRLPTLASERYLQKHAEACSREVPPVHPALQGARNPERYT